MRTFFVGPFILVAILASAPSSSAGSSYIGTAWAFPIVKSTLKYDVDDLDEKGKTKALLPDIVFTIHDASTWSAELDGGDSISGTYTVKMSDSKVEVVALEFDAASVAGRRYRIYEYDLKRSLRDSVAVKVPAALTPKLNEQIAGLSRLIYRTLGVRHSGDLRI